MLFPSQPPPDHVLAALPNQGAGGAWRGYNVVPAKGLCLVKVHYPPEADDPGSFLYPDLPHDEYGRLLVRIPGGTSDEEGSG